MWEKYVGYIFKEKEEEVKTAISSKFKITKTVSKMSSEFSSHFGSKRKDMGFDVACQRGSQDFFAISQEVLRPPATEKSGVSYGTVCWRRLSLSGGGLGGFW